jgi:hypothetical protein
VDIAIARFAGRVLFAAGVFAACAAAADGPGYRAGVARLDVAPGIRADAIALEDSRGNRAVLVRTNARLSRTVADLAGARAEKSYNLRRSCLLLESTASGAASVGELADGLFTAAGAALGDLQPARLGFSGTSGALVISTPAGETRASFPDAAQGPLRPVRGPIRCAFRVLDAQSELAPPDGPSAPARASYSVQAIRFGTEVTLVALAGDVPPAAAARLSTEFGSPAEPVLIVDRSNGDAAFDPSLAGQGMESALESVGRRFRRAAGSAR